MRSLFPRFLLRSVAVAAAASAFVACKQDKEHPGMPVDPGGTGGHEDASTPPPPDPCLSPGYFGCACDETGAIAECGKVVTRNGDYVTCSMGRSTCDGESWGECIGDHIVAKSLPGHMLGASGRQILGTPVNCANICDPNDCKSVVNTGKDVEAGGLTITDAGVSITPGEAGTGGTGPCKGLFCQIAKCDGGATTTISGVVYDPAGKNPLYNAFVYIPTDPTIPLPTFASGASCDTCAGTGTIAAISMAQTGPDGKFTLTTNVPSGTGIPLVIQMGKWRRKVTLPAITPCTNNVVAPANSRLPRNRTDGDASYADIPKMAIATGGADPFECLLLKAGIDASEIDLPSKGRRIDFYRFPTGGGIDRAPGGAPNGTTLTASLNALKPYDVVLLPCEGYENTGHNTDAADLVSYADIGGRVFATHFSYAWLTMPVSNVPNPLAGFYKTANWYLDHTGYNDPMTGTVDQSFPKGVAFAQWLLNVGASSVLGKMSINEPRWDAKSAIKPPSQRWMYGRSSGSSSDDMLLSMTFNTPLTAAAANQCGRVVFSDFHVSADALVSSTSCNVDDDCGFGATCLPPIVGTCTPQACGSNTTCTNELSGSSCVGRVTGNCVADTCVTSSDCVKGTCVSGKCKCSSDSHCGSDDCRSSTGCISSTCVLPTDCGGSQVCTGVPGVCQKACTANSQCGSALCVGGFCKGCYSDGDCPGSSAVCTGGRKPGTCSASGAMFPLTCRNGNLSAQEKALEFMLFDLTACVSPDSWVPPAPTTVYNPTTFTQDFTATCAKGKRPAWREFDWQDSIPSTASIDFWAQTAETTAALASAQLVTVASDTTGTVLPAWDVALLDTTTGGVLRTASPPVISKNILRMTITLNPTTDKKASPTLMQWKVQYDCVDAE